ncbi:hypothetical protein Ancab_035515 [Ancistrocladus abbreviatus]
MLSRVNSAVWMEDTNREDDNSSASWNRNTAAGGGGVGVDNRAEDVVSMSPFKPMLEVENEWYMTNTSTIRNHSEIRDLSFSPNLTEADNLLLQPIDSSSSCSPSPSVFNTLDPSQVHYLLPSKSTISSLLNVVPSNPLDHGFDLGGHGFFQETQVPDLMNRAGGILGGFSELSSQGQMGSPNLSSNPQFTSTHFLQMAENGTDYGSMRFRGFEEGLGNGLFMNRSKLLKPLENCASIGAQPTLFQKRAALRKNLANNLMNSSSGCGGISNAMEESGGKVTVGEEGEKMRKNGSGDGLDNISIDGSALNYDSDEFTEINKVAESPKNEGINSNANSTVTAGGGDSKGKKKGMPAKNLMAERRRRKKLNERLYMLRSVVPKISKMDRASILGDAIEYLKELLQKINDLHNELESSTPPTSSLTQTTSFYPLTPTLPHLPSRIKEELCPSSLPSPNGQPARIEVRLREGRAVNIHMFCARTPGLLLSIMRALDSLGLDIQQAVISCFNGFAMDIFRAEQCKEGQDVHPEQIKALLMESASCHGHGSAILGSCEV